MGQGRLEGQEGSNAGQETSPAACCAACWPHHTAPRPLALADVKLPGRLLQTSLGRPRLDAGRRGAALFLRAYSAVAAALALLVAAECYFTSRYFHPPGEILLAAAIGAAMFQAPLLGYARWVLGHHAAGAALAAPRRAAGGKSLGD